MLYKVGDTETIFEVQDIRCIEDTVNQHTLKAATEYAECFPEGTTWRIIETHKKLIRIIGENDTANAV